MHPALHPRTALGRAGVLGFAVEEMRVTISGLRATPKIVPLYLLPRCRYCASSVGRHGLASKARFKRSKFLSKFSTVSKFWNLYVGVC